jgi:hypothetical protein
MTTIGKIDVFDETQQSGGRMSNESSSTNSAEFDRKQNVFIIKDLLLPEKPADKNFDEIVSTLQKRLNPKPLEIAERFRF